jgi:hypothetical protein
MNKYVAYYSGKDVEIEAESLYAAKLAAVAHFKPRKKVEHMVHVYLVQLNGQDIPQSTMIG